MARDRVRLMGAVRRMRSFFATVTAYREFREGARDLIRLRLQIGGYKRLRHFFLVWRVLHVVLSVLLVFIIAAHVGVSWALGYHWLF